MNKVKKIIIAVLLFVTGCVLGAAVVIYTDSNRITSDELKAYLTESVIPSVVNVFTLLGSLYLGLYPIIKKVIAAGDGFTEAKEIVTSVSGSASDTNVKVGNLTSKLESQIQAVYEVKDRISLEQAAFDEKIAQLNTGIVNVQKMIAMGFGNESELVRSGCAREIYKIMEGENADEEKEG